MKFIIFGLGHFGYALASRLTNMGHEVLGIDNNMNRVEAFKEDISHTICMDATDQMSVRGLPLKDADAVIIAIGENEGASIMTTALLKKLNAKRIIGRVTSPLQKNVLETMGITEFVDPETETADRLANTLDIKNVIDSFQISEKYRIMEITVPDRYIGFSVEKADLLNRYKVTLLAIIRKENEKNILGTIQTKPNVIDTPSPSFVMEKNDVLVLFGEMKDIEALMR
ncbi:MAG: TrkA family potassium uptake protein [Chitinophagales bacterium]|nr:TrkA family potassium uptake protein [Chitinophagales bacterium]MCZ2393966.1 TrkA family potassium uptake protein [Chitinophagales bacterium]